MLYGRSMRKDKARDIARGVLPSTARKGAREEKREYHAKHRHAQRQANHAISRHCAAVDDDGYLYTDPDLYDDFEALDTFDGYHAATKKPSIGWDDMTEIVRNRRDADKLGPLLSWARATEKNKMVGWSAADKVAYFKAVLPDTLQGRHALGHIETALSLYADPFLYGYYRYSNHPDPISKDKFRAALARCLSSTKARTALREYILDTVPVAAHHSEANNKIRSQAPAVDEDGNTRYLPPHLFPGVPGYLPRRPYMVEVYIPQIVSTTCDDCSFLRNDPLATTEAINRFVDIVWPKRRLYPTWRDRAPVDHTFVREIYDYVIAGDS